MAQVVDEPFSAYGSSGEGEGEPAEEVEYARLPSVLIEKRLYDPETKAGLFNIYLQARTLTFAQWLRESIIRALQDTTMRAKLEEQKRRNIFAVRERKKKHRNAMKECLHEMDPHPVGDKCKHDVCPILQHQGSVFLFLQGLYRKVGGSFKPPYNIERVMHKLHKAVKEQADASLLSSGKRNTLQMRAHIHLDDFSDYICARRQFEELRKGSLMFAVEPELDKKQLKAGQPIGGKIYGSPPPETKPTTKLVYRRETGDASQPEAAASSMRPEERKRFGAKAFFDSDIDYEEGD